MNTKFRSTRKWSQMKFHKSPKPRHFEDDNEDRLTEIMLGAGEKNDKSGN